MKGNRPNGLAVVSREPKQHNVVFPIRLSDAHAIICGGGRQGLLPTVGLNCQREGRSAIGEPEDEVPLIFIIKDDTQVGARLAGTPAIMQHQVLQWNVARDVPNGRAQRGRVGVTDG